MPQARGSQAAFNIYDETTYGSDPGTPSATKLYLKSFGLSSSQNKIESETLTGVRTQLRPTGGNIDAVGALVAELGAESVGKLLKHSLGQVATTGTGPYVHTITLGDLPVGFVAEKDHGSNISGSGRVEKFNGCRIASTDVDIPNEGNVSITFNVQAANSALASAVLDATPTDNGHTTFSVASLGTIEEGGAAIATIKSMKFSLNNDLDTDGYVLGAAGIRAELAEGFAMVTGEITAVFSSAALLTKAINSTETSLKAILSRGDGLGTTGNESIEFFCETMEYERKSPPVEGPKGILQTLSFKAYGTNALKVILKNAVATL